MSSDDEYYHEPNATTVRRRRLYDLSGVGAYPRQGADAIDIDGNSSSGHGDDDSRSSDWLPAASAGATSQTPSSRVPIQSLNGGGLDDIWAAGEPGLEPEPGASTSGHSTGLTTRDAEMTTPATITTAAATSASVIHKPPPVLLTSARTASDDEFQARAQAQAHVHLNASGATAPDPDVTTDVEPPAPRVPEANAEVPVAEERQCRICLGGDGDEEQAELGRLFRPCRCRGSMKYVHVSCLNEWRKAAQSSTSYWACDQCKYKYSLARTNAVFVTSPVALGFTTTFLLTSLIFLSSFLVSFFVPDLDPSTSAAYLDKARPESSLEYYWGYSSAYNAASDIIGLAVHTLNDAVFHQDGRDADDAGNLYYETWKRWTTPSEGSSRASAKVRERADTADRYIKAHARKQFSRSRHPDKSERLKEECEDATANRPPPPSSEGYMSLPYRLAQRFIVGMSFLGIVSFLNLLISLSFYAPAQLMRRGRGLLGGRRARGDRATAGGFDVGTALVVLFVAIGVARAIYKIYQFNRYLARKLLARAETAILEVGDDDQGAPGGTSRGSGWSASWRRPWGILTFWARKLYDVVGDPLEPFHLKVARNFARLVSWGIRGAIRAWQDFGALREI